MARPNVEAIKARAKAIPDMEITTEENGLLLKCEDVDKQAIRDYVNDFDGYVLKLISWIEYLEDEVELAGINLDRP